jgi:hypothetical protein
MRNTLQFDRRPQPDGGRAVLLSAKVLYADVEA